MSTSPLNANPDAVTCQDTPTQHALHFLERLVGKDIVSRFSSETLQPLECLKEPVAEASTIMPAMFKIVNTFALTGTCIVVLYILAIGIMHTAHEGESLGKRYSTLWTPIRAALGVTFVAPVPFFGGFSILQTLIIGLVVLSHTGANTLWNATVDYFVEHKTLLAKPAYVPSDPRHSFMALQAEACTLHQYRMFIYTKDGMKLMDRVKAYENSMATTGPGGQYGTAHSYQIALDRLNESMPRRAQSYKDYALTWSPECGAVNYECQHYPDGSLEKKYCDASYRAQNIIAEYFADPKDGIVPLLYKYHFDGVEIPPGLTLPPPKQVPGGEETPATFDGDVHPVVQALARADEVYASAYRSVISNNAALDDKQELDRQMEEWAKEVKNDWIKAGQWHWVLHKKSYETIGAMSMNPMWKSASSKNAQYEELQEFQEVLRKFIEENEIIQFDGKGNPTGIRVEPLREGDGALDILNKIAGPRIWSMYTFLDSEGDPIGQLANYGHMMINTSSAIIATSFLLKAGGEQAGHTPGISWFGGKFVDSVISSVVTLVMFLIGPLMLAGGFLAYYLPAIPYIFWMFGIIGWMIMVCESLVAAPIWAGAHALPEGEGMSGRYAVQGYQLLTNVLFRPILLLLGLVLSMQVLQFICYLAIEGFKVVNHAITGTGSEAFSFGISQYFAILFMNLILVGLILSLSHKSYEMIFETADNVMRWVGFGTRPLGEAQGEQATSRTYAGAAIYSRDAAGAAAAKSGNPSPHPDPGGHEAHNARTGKDTDYNGGGDGNNSPVRTPDGGGSPVNGGDQGPTTGGDKGAPSSTPQGGDGPGNNGGGDKQIR